MFSTHSLIWCVWQSLASVTVTAWRKATWQRSTNPNLSRSTYPAHRKTLLNSEIHSQSSRLTRPPGNSRSTGRSFTVIIYDTHVWTNADPRVPEKNTLQRLTGEVEWRSLKFRRTFVYPAVMYYSALRFTPEYFPPSEFMTALRWYYCSHLRLAMWSNTN